MKPSNRVLVAVLWCACCAGVSMPACTSSPGTASGAPPASSVPLETLDLSAMSQDWGAPHPGQSVESRSLTLAGTVYAHGVGTHAAGQFDIALDRAATRFTAVVGVDDEVGARGSVDFEVRVDGRVAARVGPLHGGDRPASLSVDLTGAGMLTLLVDDAGDGLDDDHADWADARIDVLPGGAARVRAVPPPPDVAPDIVHAESPVPAIHGPRVVGSTPGRPFLFRIPATGQGPLRFAATGLPPGLQLDAATGLVTGSLQGVGSRDVALQVSGPAGAGRRSLRITGGEHELALTPPLGWNSWNAWGTSVDDAKVRAAADAMERSGLVAHGFSHVNIDDGWEAGRDAQGRIESNAKFPDMHALADAVHARGLKLGIYSSPGPKTCAGFEGSLGHEREDVARWAEWGIDYVKYDWCSYGDAVNTVTAGKDESLPELRHPYEVLRAALDAAPRDIVFSLCQYGMGDVWNWGADVGGNLWRTTNDVSDSWSSVSGIGFRQDVPAPHAQPGHWNDPDMLVVGQVGWGPTLHATHLSHNEQITHITLWSLLAAPLLIGSDMTQLDPFTRALLTNDDVLDVDQDPLGVAAHRVGPAQDVRRMTEVWARPLFDGALAVGLFNRGPRPAVVSVSWEALGLTGRQVVRNAWLRRDEGLLDGGFSTEVPRHGAVLLIVGRRE